MKQEAIPVKNWKQDLLPYLPETVNGLLSHIAASEPLEEIRIRAERPLQLCFHGYERLLYLPGGSPVVSAVECNLLLHRLCEQSVYAWETELGNGFLTLPGGYRVGLCGQMRIDAQGVRRLSEVTAFNIRIARQVIGAADGVLPMLTDAEGRMQNTLLISAPGCGKTTLLRDLARSASCGRMGVKPCRVAVVDARYELSGASHGAPQMDLGPRTDVLSGVPRAEGMRMLVTGMSPELIVTDELSTWEDMRAVREAVHSGVRVAASAHAGSMRDLLCREEMRKMLCEGVFARIVLLSRSRGVATVEQVLDARMRLVESGGNVCCAQLPS